MKKFLRTGLITILSVLASIQATAAIIVTESTNILGINQLFTSSDGKVYDITFGNVWNGFDGSLSLVTEATNSLFSLIDGSVLTGEFSTLDQKPWSVVGCTSGTSCTMVFRVRSSNPSYGYTGSVYNHNGSVEALTSTPNDSKTINNSLVDLSTLSNNLSGSGNSVFANLRVSNVPEPSTYAMMSIGLLGVIWMSRRRQDIF